MIVLAAMLALCRAIISVNDLLTPRQLRYEKMHVRLAMNPIYSLSISELGAMAGYYPGVVTLRRVEDTPFWRMEWQMFIDGVRVCHKKDNRVDACLRGENVESNWIVRKRENETFVFKTQAPDGWYCMTYGDGVAQGLFQMSLCMEGNPKQKFIIREAPECYLSGSQPALPPMYPGMGYPLESPRDPAPVPPPPEPRWEGPGIGKYRSPINLDDWDRGERRRERPRRHRGYNVRSPWRDQPE